MFHSLPRNSEEWRIKNPISLVLRWQNIKPSALDSRNHGSRQWWTMGYEVIPGANRDVLLKLLNSPFNFTGEFEDWKLARLIRWNREVFNDPYFPFMDPQLIAYFSSPVPDFLIRVWEIFFIPNMQEEEKNYATRFLTSLETFIMENIPNKWRNEMETSKIERIVFWLILHAFFNNFFYHLLILWLNNKLSIDNIHDSRVIPLDNRQKNLVIITISCSWWSKLSRF